MTVGDLRNMLAVLPDNFAIRIDCKSDVQEHVRSVSLEQGALVLRQHMLSVGQVMDTITAHDGVEYVIAIEKVSYPKVVEMTPNLILKDQLNRSFGKLGNGGTDVA